MRELLRRLQYLLQRSRRDDELADEMAFHREMAERDGGMPLGNTLRLREESRDAWGLVWLDHLGQDLRYTFRAMRSSPGFTTTAVLVLSIGIGATVAAFSAFNVVALRPLPVTNPDTILRFQRQAPTRSATEIPYDATLFYRDQSRTLSAVLAQTSSRLSLDGSDQAATTSFVTANFFEQLGGRAAVGRVFRVGDQGTTDAPVVVLGYGFWASQFGSDPSVVGRSVRLGGKVVTIIGVAAREFSGLSSGNAPAFWAVLDEHDASRRGVTMWGRLAPGASVQMVEDELSSLAAQLRTLHPTSENTLWEGERLIGSPAGYGEVGSTEMLALVVALVLLIFAVACGNLGSLLLARGAARQREMALRKAIGAGPGRLLRQLLTESFVLAMMGCVGGLVLGSTVLKGIMVWTEAPSWLDPTPDWRVVVFAVTIGVVAAVIFGLAPALHLARRTRATPRGRTFLIGMQVASSCVLLIIAGLLGRALDRAISADPGFEYEQVIVIEPSLIEQGYTADRARVYLQDLRARLVGMAGVENVSVTSSPPLGGTKVMGSLQVDGRTLDVYINQVDQHYLSTMTIPLLRGRHLQADDVTGIVVSESLASRYWPGRDALGQSFGIGEETFTVLGVAGNARSLALGDPDSVELYRLAPAADATSLAMVVRTSTAPDLLYSSVVTAANGVDSNFKPRVVLLRDRFAERVKLAERSAVAVSLLGVIALAVACLGVVGLVAYAVAQRTKEIGIRLSLGAQPRHILGGLSRQFVGTLMGGLVVGVCGAAGVAQLLRRELYGVSTIDPLAYLTAIVIFVVAVCVAGMWPARRALRVDPLVALRTD